MKVTPLNRKFGKYVPGDEFELPDKVANVLIKLGKLQAVQSGAAVYQTRTMHTATAEPAAEVSPRTGLPKRQYRRRDMRAES